MILPDLNALRRRVVGVLVEFGTPEGAKKGWDTRGRSSTHRDAAARAAKRIRQSARELGVSVADRNRHALAAINRFKQTGSVERKNPWDSARVPWRKAYRYSKGR